MNELKPEDVMKALEYCAHNMRCYECPYVIVKGGKCHSNMITDALALLREKDARIEQLEAENREVHSNWQKLKKSLDEVSEEDKRILAEKDAEIERLHGVLAKKEEDNT